LNWTHCYDDTWKGLIVDEAFAHPAKFARGLIRRIYAHALGAGYLKPGDIVIDPFGGVALGGLDASMLGLHWRGCELEPRFVALAEQNIALWQRWQPDGTARIVQGDSRQLGRVLQTAGAVVSSPPYVSGGHHNDVFGAWNKNGGGQGVGSKEEAGYGHTPAQLGQMKEGDLSEVLQAGAVVSSPPYADHLGDGKNGIDTSKMQRASAGQKRGPGCKHEATFQAQSSGYGTTPGNLSALPAAVVLSPPYEGGPVNSTSNGIDWQKAGQLGNEQGETFWSAARLIVAECYKILRPGGYAFWVCKDFVRDKARVPFSDQWRQLCESCGFVTVEWIKASLVKEWTENTLFNGTETKRKERKSFFRRLAEKKGSPRIDHEDVIVMRKKES
jgi:hypothetical protein